MLVDFVRTPHLLDLAIGHHGDTVAHRQCLFLVMGHEQKRNAGLALQLLEFQPHGLAQLEIESRQRLVKKKDLGTGRECASQRNALLLSPPRAELGDGRPVCRA